MSASTTVIIDYGSGNLRSAAKAFERACATAGDGGDVVVTGDAARLDTADRIVLPGVGAFGDCAAGLRALPGMVDALNDNVIRRGKPFLGICVGMQLMAERGLEHGAHDGLGWIRGEVTAIHGNDADGRALKVPHMGWNNLVLRAPAHPLFTGVPTGAHAYFVHGYRMEPANAADVLAEVAYGGAVAAAVGHDNMAGTQFHPEKSQNIGLRVIANFLAWRP